MPGTERVIAFSQLAVKGLISFVVVVVAVVDVVVLPAGWVCVFVITFGCDLQIMSMT
jgi:hypothetical protein